jgi:hypothetical protein
MNNHKTLQLAQEEWKKTHKKKKRESKKKQSTKIPTTSPSLLFCLKELPGKMCYIIILRSLIYYR